MPRASANRLKPCTAVWLLLVGLTLVTYTVGELGLGEGGMAMLVLAIAALKSLFVADHFMGLRRVAGFWRPLIVGYLVLLGMGLAFAFVLAR